MKTVILVVATGILVLVSAVSAVARLGETPKQIETRYGPVQERDSQITTNDSNVYRTEKFTVRVHFTNGASDAESYVVRADALDERTVKALLEAHAQGSEWREAKSNGIGWEYWRRADDRAMAAHCIFPGSMTICTLQFWKAMQDHLAEEARKPTEGF